MGEVNGRESEIGVFRSHRRGVPRVSTFLLPPVPVASLDAYLASEVGGAGVRRALEIGRATTIDVVSRSGLRGRGGGGFRTGEKWEGVAAQTGGRRHVVCNCDHVTSHDLAAAHES